MHRNLTPKNILLNARGRAKVAGFSLSATHQSEGPTTMFRRAVGSPVFLGPSRCVKTEKLDQNRCLRHRRDPLFLVTGVGRRSRAPTSSRRSPRSSIKPQDHSDASTRPSQPNLSSLSASSACGTSPAGAHETAAAVADDLGRWLRRIALCLGPERPIDAHWSGLSVRPSGRDWHGVMTILLSLIAPSLMRVMAPTTPKQSPRPMTCQLRLQSQGGSFPRAKRPRPLSRFSPVMAAVPAPRSASMRPGSFVTAAHVVADVLKPGSGTFVWSCTAAKPARECCQPDHRRRRRSTWALLQDRSGSGSESPPWNWAE